MMAEIRAERRAKKGSGGRAERKTERAEEEQRGNLRRELIGKRGKLKGEQEESLNRDSQSAFATILKFLDRQRGQKRICSAMLLNVPYVI
jgi:hypothetical protein